VTPKPKNRTECISIILGQCSSWIKSVIHEPREYRDAQDRLWRDKACPALTKLIMSRKALTSIDIDILIITVTFFVIISIIIFLIIINIIIMNLVTAVFRRPSCLRHPLARHNRLDSFPSQMHRLDPLQVAMFKSLQKGLPRKALPLQPQFLPRKRLSQNWDTGEISHPPTLIDKPAPFLRRLGCTAGLIGDEGLVWEL